MAAEGRYEQSQSKSWGRLSRWYLRVPLKWLVFFAVTFFVLWPNPRRFSRHLSHLRNLDALVEPDAPQLAVWDDELRERLRKRATSEGAADEPEDHPLQDPSPRRAQKEVETFVYEKVKYRWDWELWGAADYMPTVAEMFAMAAGTQEGRLYEDCDGRAVMAASLMRRLGYEASLVTDLRHVWVTTPQGEWMGPGGKKTVVSTPQGNRLDLQTAWKNVPISLSFGISVFPLSRELVILLTAYVLMLHRRMSWRGVALGGLLLLQGLLFMRCGVLLPRTVSTFAPSWPAVVGILHLLAGFAVLLWTARRARSKVAQPCSNKGRS